VKSPEKETSPLRFRSTGRHRARDAAGDRGAPWCRRLMFDTNGIREVSGQVIDRIWGTPRSGTTAAGPTAGLLHLTYQDMLLTRCGLSAGVG